MKASANLALALALALGAAGARAQGRLGDPPPPRDLPGFWKSRLEDVESEVRSVAKGSVETIAVSPGGRPVKAVALGLADDLHSEANSSCAIIGGLIPVRAPSSEARSCPVSAYWS